MKAQLDDAARLVIYEEVVLPLVEAAQESGLSYRYICEYLGVEYTTFVWWRKNKFTPTSRAQKRIKALTIKLRRAINAGYLPLPSPEEQAQAILEKF